MTLARILQAEEDLLALVTREYLAMVHSLPLGSRVSLTAAGTPTPSQYAGISNMWRTISKGKIEPALYAIYRQNMAEFIKANGLEGKVPEGYLAVERNVLADKYVAERRNLIRGVGEDVFKDIQYGVHTALEAGQGAGPLSDDIATIMHTGLSRARTIARTEAAAAVNGADHAVITNSGLKGTRYWLATEDDRTRETHADVDGQPEQNGGWQVGECFLLYPCQTSSSCAEEVVNCRCTTTFELDDE